MSKENQETETTASDKALPSSTGSEYRIAIAGYMADRHELITKIPEVNLYYEREKSKQAWMIAEIERIDCLVANLLKELCGISSPNE